MSLIQIEAYNNDGEFVAFWKFDRHTCTIKREGAVIQVEQASNRGDEDHPYMLVINLLDFGFVQTIEEGAPVDGKEV